MQHHTNRMLQLPIGASFTTRDFSSNNRHGKNYFLCPVYMQTAPENWRQAKIGLKRQGEETAGPTSTLPSTQHIAMWHKGGAGDYLAPQRWRGAKARDTDEQGTREGYSATKPEGDRGRGSWMASPTRWA